ncbi:MAG: hypothetical protein LBB48_09915 [Treponema sp.]|jgi:hypothetical protein|nr:hypothetical protein [Treponema sp.]
MKKLFFVFLTVCVLTGAVSAQSLSNGFLNPSSGLNLDLLQWGGNYDPGASKAALLNTAFGIWSFKNNDLFGGILTASLEGVGLALVPIGIVVATSGTGDSKSLTTGTVVMLIGTAIMTGGIVFGYFRGSSQYKKQNAATAWTGNPLDHITAVALPAPNGVTGSLTFKAAF